MESNNVTQYLIRPVNAADLPAIYEIAMMVGPSISLPNDQKTIQKKIERSLESFALKNPIEDRLFFLVLENTEDNKILGTAAIESRAGSILHPFFNFTVTRVASISRILNYTSFHKVLFLANNYQDASLLGTLYLNKKCRGLGLGQFLSRSRCLFIAQFPDLFSDVIVANMRGVFDDQNISPFWQAIGRQFFNMDFYKAYFRFSTEGVEMISDLAPKYPIYFSMLPKDAQDIIGKTHANTKAALHLLEKEGFIYRDVIDFFDGGPIVEVTKKLLKAMNESHVSVVAKIVPQLQGEKLFMISTTNLDFRVARGKLELIEPGKVILEESLARVLKVGENDKIRYYAL